MKKIKTFSDGSYMPIWQEDFGYIQDNLIEIITEHAKAFANGRSRYILSGCFVEYDGNTCRWSKGLVMYDGELLVLSSSSTTFHHTLSTPVAVIQLNDSYNHDDGYKLFKKADGTYEFRETYWEKVAEIVVMESADVPPGSLVADGLGVISTLSLKGDWADIIAPVGSISYTVQVKKQGDLVCFRGQGMFAKTKTMIGTLGIGLRPSQELVIGDFTVKTDGTINVSPGVTKIRLDELAFMI